MIDLQDLQLRESEQTEWKENVADIDDVVETLAAYANDLANLGGGYVVCGAREVKDAHGFPKVERVGLQAARLKEVQGTVMTRCRERVSPPITPLVEVLPGATDEAKILAFVQPATGQAQTFRRGDHGAKHFVRVGHSTIEARNGVLRDLLVRKGALEPWDRRPCAGATTADLDLLALRDALQRMASFHVDRGVEGYLSDEVQLSPFVPPLCAREALTGTLRPRNFALLLFGRETQRWVPGAFSIFSIYPGVDRSDSHAERHELAGNLLEQARRLRQLLDVQSYAAFDKTDPASPNALTYPQRALYEAMGNALAHRDYELVDPTRVTVFADRLEILSPGSLPPGVEVTAFREGRAGARWRNQALAWFLSRLQFAQAEGQGIPTILRVMREEGSPPPVFEVNGTRVVCILPAHPRHALLQELRGSEQALALGEFRQAQAQVQQVLTQDPLNYRALQLLAEVQHALHDPAPVVAAVSRHLERMAGMPSTVLIQLAEALTVGDDTAEANRILSRKLLGFAVRARLEERELRRIAVALLRAQDAQAALDLLDLQLSEHPEWRQSASLHQLRGDAMLGLAKRCRVTARNHDLKPATRQRAWREFHAHLDAAEHELREALALSVDTGLNELIDRNLGFLDRFRRENQPSRSSTERRQRNGSGHTNGRRR